jgi:hypothetical protein
VCAALCGCGGGGVFLSVSISTVVAGRNGEELVRPKSTVRFDLLNCLADAVHDF